MLKFVRKLVAPVLGWIDRWNIAVEPFKDPDYSHANLPPLDTITFKLATTRDTCHADLPRFVKDGAFFWDVVPNDLGDNCLWQGVYLAYLSMLGDIGGVNKAMVEAMIPLTTYGGPGVVLRGVAHRSTFTPPAGDKRYFTTADGWVCLPDASMGSLLGFCYGLTYAITAPRSCRHVDSDLARKMAERVADTLIANDFRLVNPDGTPTPYGNLNPNLAQVPARILGLLSLLKLAGKTELYNKVWDEALPVLEYGETHFVLPGVPKVTFHPWYQDHLAFLTYDMLLTLESDAKRRAPYVRGLKRLWAKDKRWWNPYFTAVAAKHIPIEERDYNMAIAGLFDYSYPAIKMHGKKNSIRKDIEIVKYDGVLFAARPLRISERPPSNYLWQRSPYRLDGEPIAAYNGLDFLIPYMLFTEFSGKLPSSFRRLNG